MKGNKIVSTIVALTLIFSAVVVLNTMTEFKFVEEARATTPGVDVFSGNGSIAVTHPDELLNTSTSTLKYDPDTAVTIQVNGSISTWSGVYYLYYPVYSGKSVLSGGSASYNLTWRKYEGSGTGSVPHINATSGDFTFGGGMDKNVYLNHSGIWLIDDDATHDMSNRSLKNSTIPAWFWVNTSADSLSVSISDNRFKYGDTGAFSVTVGAGDTGIAEAIVAITNASGKLVGTWNYNQWTSGLVASNLLSKNSSVFNNAGTWYVDAYYDADNDGANDQVSYYEGSGAGYYYYNASSYGNRSTFTSSATQYNFTLCGPWDPPEYNATTKTVTVQKAQPTMSITNNSVYWGFPLKIEVNVTDADGAGITDGNVSLRKVGNSTYIYNLNYSNIWINQTGSGNYTVEIAKIVSGSPGFWAVGNGTYRVYFKKDSNNDSIEEYNTSKTINILSSTPPVDLKIVDDGSGSSRLDNKVDVPQYGWNSYENGTLDIVFQITGTDVGDAQGRAYYGDDAGEDRHNITITGDVLFTPTDTSLTYSTSSDYWTFRCTPTKPGGSITISVDWPGSNNGTDSETINIINGTTVTASADEFTIGQDINLTFTVMDKWGTLLKTSSVNMFWNDTASLINQTNGTGAAGYGADGEYTFWIQPSDQGSSAPKYAVVAAHTPGSTWWGYTKVKMVRNHDLFVNCTPTSGYAGDTVEYDIEVLVDGTTVPVDEGSSLTIELYNETGHLVTAAADAWSLSGDYSFTDQEKDLSAGTYYLYAYNDTHDSEGHNATIVISAYTVESNPSVLAWLIDTSENITFSVTPAVNGTLKINNMSGTKNCSDTSSAGYSIQVIDGQATLSGVNATTLGNLTYEFTPESGVERHALGVLDITTANAVPSPATVYIGEATIVEITVTHPETGAALENVRVGLDHGVALNNSKLAKLPDDVFTDANGKAQFSITSEASGNITIYIKNGTDPNNKHVIKSAAKKTLTVTADPSVNEGNEFTATVKDANGDLVTDTVTITFNGQTYTTTTGTKTLTAPTVPESLDYTVSATATGYYPDDTTVKVIDVPKLSITVTGTKENGVYTSPVTVIVYNDNGDLVTGATVTFGTDTGITVGGKAEFSVTNTDAQDYTISASFSGFEDADDLTIKAKATGTPGFELLTLIAAIGVAFILLRRRRH